MPSNEYVLGSVSGPTTIALDLNQARSFTIGRVSSHALCLDDPQVSRDHAALTFEAEPAGGGRWLIEDLGSRHGTRVNGQLLAPNRPCPIREGDFIEIRPWTFQLINRDARSEHGARLKTLNDSVAGGLSTMPLRIEAAAELDRHRLRLILDCVESMQRATGMKELASAVIDAAMHGTGFSNAAVVGPLRPDGEVELIAQRGEIANDQAEFPISRTLIQQASAGRPVQMLNRAGALNETASVIDLGIQQAICVPLVLESSVIGFVYLDHRDRTRRTPHMEDAGAFIAGLARLASLALANMMRQDLEKRFAHMEGELAAAAVAQQLILPKRAGAFGPVEFMGECRAGRTISGDFFDVFELPENRIAFTIGDVAGKGVPASVLMTTTQGFLHGALRQHADPARAARDLNVFVNQRGEAGRFVTLWIGVLDHAQRLLRYVNAGHSYVWRVNEQGICQLLDEPGGPPIGVSPDFPYISGEIELEEHGSIAMVSDGIVEQSMDRSRHGEQFGRSRVQQALAERHLLADPVERIFAAVRQFGQNRELADDATVVIVRW